MAGSVVFIVPGPIDQRTGGYIYDRRIVLGLRARGRWVEVVELPGRFPFADATARAAALRCVEGLAAGALPVIDGLALPAFARVLDRLPPWVALIHHPLGMETGLGESEARALLDLEREMLRAPARIVVTGPQTVRDLERLDVAPARVAVVRPGTDPAPLARGSGGPARHMLCVASLTPRKGHPVLLEALAGLVDLDWRLTCVGSPDLHPPTAAAIRAAIEERGLGERVALVGERPAAELAPFYDAADLFVLASHHEGYGMALGEALARGLPVVTTRAGAIPDTVPATAGLLVPPGDPAALAGALRRVLTDGGLRRRLAEGARAARAALPSWDEAVAAFAAELGRIPAT
ncbi:MAG TPA: glycosyltransferase family 4 protein [Geminicoccaceae bacterium]|nr:glycosyltransferase family 4 protein [Geminicoccaceae bacterium]